MLPSQLGEPVQLDPHAQLERALIEEHLRGQGWSLARLHELPEAEARQLMAEASLYASIRLTEIENRARFVHDVHGVAPPLG
jgi:hypothetical protein